MVVFPAPEGPTTAVKVPGRRVRETPLVGREGRREGGREGGRE
jgi:hypothetical protein